MSRYGNQNSSNSSINNPQSGPTSLTSPMTLRSTQITSSHARPSGESGAGTQIVKELIRSNDGISKALSERFERMTTREEADPQYRVRSSPSKFNGPSSSSSPSLNTPNRAAERSVRFVLGDLGTPSTTPPSYVESPLLSSFSANSPSPAATSKPTPRRAFSSVAPKSTTTPSKTSPVEIGNTPQEQTQKALLLLLEEMVSMKQQMRQLSETSTQSSQQMKQDVASHQRKMKLLEENQLILERIIQSHIERERQLGVDIVAKERKFAELESTMKFKVESLQDDIRLCNTEIQQLQRTLTNEKNDNVNLRYKVSVLQDQLQEERVRHQNYVLEKEEELQRLRLHVASASAGPSPTASVSTRSSSSSSVPPQLTAKELLNEIRELQSELRFHHCQDQHELQSHSPPESQPPPRTQSAQSAPPLPTTAQVESGFTFGRSILPMSTANSRAIPENNPDSTTLPRYQSRSPTFPPNFGRPPGSTEPPGGTFDRLSKFLHTQDDDEVVGVMVK